MFETFASKVLSKLPSQRKGKFEVNKVNQAGFHFLDSTEQTRTWGTVQSVHAFTSPMFVGYTFQLAVSFLDGDVILFNEAESMWDDFTIEISARLGVTSSKQWTVKLIAEPNKHIELFRRASGEFKE